MLKILDKTWDVVNRDSKGIKKSFIFVHFFVFAALFDHREHLAKRLCPGLPWGAPQSCVWQQRQDVQIDVCLPESSVH